MSDVWADERALYIWSGGVRADLTPIKEAKVALGIEEKVRPIGVGSLSDLPDLYARVLAIGSRPPFLCEYALTSERTSSEGWQRALSWVLGVTEHDPKATTLLDVISAAFPPDAETGAMVREISAAELEDERKLREYQSGGEYGW